MNRQEKAIIEKILDNDWSIETTYNPNFTIIEISRNNDGRILARELRETRYDTYLLDLAFINALRKQEELNLLRAKCDGFEQRDLFKL